MLFLPNTLSTEIKKLVAYFCVFEHPLTAWEIWQYLPVASNFLTVQKVLSVIASPDEHRGEAISLNLETKNGFYYLPGQSAVITTRQERYSITDRKIKRLKPVAKIFSLLPWVKLICLANQIGAHNLRASGDIDLLIVCQERRLWITRLCCNGLLQLLRLRPTLQKFQNTICLSFWLAETQLNLTDYLLRQAPDLPDRYFIYWLASLKPLYDREQTYQRLLAQNNWLNVYLPNWSGRQAEVKYHYFKTRYLPGWQPIMRLIGDKLEDLAKKFQMKILAPAIKEQMNKDSRVVVNDCVLKLHTNDRRQYFFDKYQENLIRILQIGVLILQIAANTTKNYS